MTGVEPAAEWVWLARIRRPQGRKGEVFAVILTDFPEKFSERRRLWLLTREPATAALAAVPAAREVELAGFWLHKGGVVLHFKGVDSIEAAGALAGLVIAVPRSQRTALGGDEAYISDLIGCTLVDVAGEQPVTVGEIEDVDPGAGLAPLLVVRAASGEVLIPFARSYLRGIDLGGKRIEMALPEGLADLNATGNF